jgi:transposase
MKYSLLKEDIIHADETVLNVLDEKDNKNNYMWLYASGDRSSKRIYLYDYQ